MKKAIKMLIIYALILTVSDILSYVIFGTPWSFLRLFTICAILLHLGMSIQSKLARKKYFVYMGIITVQILIILALSAILSIWPENNWFGVISANIIFATLFKMMFDISKILKDSNIKASNALHTITSLLAVTIVFANIFSILYLFGVFGS